MHRALAAASVLAVVLLATVGVAGGTRSARDTVVPSSPTDIHLVSATAQSVSVAWSPSTDNVKVTGYEVSGEVQPARVREPAYVGDRLPCGESLALVVVAVDRAGNRSAPAHTIIATAPCSDVSPPSVPSGFRQSATSQNAVVLVWNPSSDDIGVVSYGVYDGGTTVGSTAEPAYTLSSLACGTTYAVAVDAADAAGNRSGRGSAWVQTAPCSGPLPPPGDTTHPSQPGSLSVASAAETSIRISWSHASDNVGIAGYDVYANGSKVGSTSSNEYEIGGLQCGSRYGIGVVAYDAAGNRSSAAAVDGTTSACPPTETPWTLCSDEYHHCSFVGTKEIRYGKDATWTAPRQFTDGVQCSNEVFGDPLPGTIKQCQVRDLPGSDPTPPQDSWITCSSEYETCTFTGTRDVRYGKNSTWTTPRPFTDGVSCSNAVFGDPLPGVTKECQLRKTTDGSDAPKPGDSTPPSQPGSLAVGSATSTSITLAWSASSDDVKVTGYGVYRDGSLVSSVTFPGATVTGLACGRAYGLGVDAYDAAGNRSGTASITATVAACSDNQAPSAPANVQATSRTATSIALSWSGSTDNVGVVGYGLYRDGVLVGTSPTTSGIFSTLTCNTNHTLAVDAYDAAGNRSAKTTVMVATTGCPDTTPPAAASGLSITAITETSIALSWNAASDNVAVTGYDVYSQGAKITTVTTTSHTFGSLACGTAYALSVVAFDAAGNRSSQASTNGSTSSCPSATPEWRVCSAEFQRCSFSGTKEVRYGKNTTWTSPRQFTDGVDCSNNVFGDPLPGITKECQTRDLAGGAPPPPSPSPAGSYPSSYYTGPLGSRNPLPPNDKAFLMLWPGSVGCDWACIKNQVVERERATGRTFDGIGNAYRPHESERVEQWVHDRGSLPIVTWNPGGPAADTIAGRKDAEIVAFARYIKSYDFIVMVRLFHEFDLSHTSYHACGDTFISQWRRVVDIFKREGVTNAGFWWSPTEGTGRACIATSYPGDTYVDWVGTDSYNFCYVGESSCWVTPMHSGWSEFSELFDYPPGPGYQSHHSIYGPRKPFVVGETATTYDPSNPSKKGQWYRNVVQAAKDMEHLTGLMIFDSDVQAAEGSKTNWLVDYPGSNGDAYAGFVAMARDPYFNSR